jgi:hypothetical protein
MLPTLSPALLELPIAASPSGLWRQWPMVFCGSNGLWFNLRRNLRPRIGVALIEYRS